MSTEKVWKVGQTMRVIQNRLQKILDYVPVSPNIYMGDDLLKKANVTVQNWDLADTDEFFGCLPQEEFARLLPYDIDKEDYVPYEEVKNPQSPPPRNIWDCETSAREILEWFDELRQRKVSRSGWGDLWPITAWAPREKFRYENLYSYARYSSYAKCNPVPWFLRDTYCCDNNPHHIYHAWHGDEGKEGAILRSELTILARCMKGLMLKPEFCVYNVPVSLYAFLFHLS